MVGKLKKITMLVVGAILWFSLYSVEVITKQEMSSGTSAPILITNVTHQEGPFGNRFILEFNTEPICNFVPENADQAEHAERYFSKLSRPGTLAQEDKDAVVDLQFMIPMASIKGKQNKHFVQQINVTKNDSYSISFEQTDLPIPGYVCKISFKPFNVGFQLEGAKSKGHPIISFTFYRYETLRKINLAANTIRQTT